MTGSRAEGEKVQDELRISCCAFLQKVKKQSESGGDVSKGHRSHPERAMADQIGENANIKINNKDNRL